MSDELKKIGEIVVRERMSRRKFLRGVGATGAGLALGPLLAACGDSTTTTTAGGTATTAAGETTTTVAATKGGSLRVGIVGGSAKDTLDPGRSSFEPDNAFVTQLYDGLMGLDTDFRLENRLAEAVEPNADASVWKIKLKSGLEWHDGKPVTAEDVVFSFQRTLDPADPLLGAPGLGGLEPNGIVKIDDSTVEFRLTKPNAIFAEGLAMRYNMIVPVGYDPAKPVGCGAFKLAEFRPGEQCSFTAFDGFWRGAPNISDLTIIEFADEAARVNAFLSDTVHAITQLPRAQVGVVEASAGHQILRAKTGAWQPFCMRIDLEPYSDVRVRQAFRLMVDREQMVEQAYAGYGWVANDMYSPFDPGYPVDLPQRAQDLEKAKALLKEAGYENLQVELITSDAIGGGVVAAAQVFAEQAKGAGVTVTVNKVDSGVMYGDQYLTWPFSQDFWYTRNYLSQAAVGTMPTAQWNETHWDDAEWLKLVEEAFRTGDETKRNELITAAATIEYERGGNIIWAFNDQIDAHSEKLTGLAPDKSGIPIGGFRFHNVSLA